MNANWKYGLSLALAAALVAPAAFAQQQGQQPPKPPVQPGQTAGQQPPTPPAEPAAPPVNAEEEAAYKAFFELPKTDSQRVVETGEDFVKKYPESRYREAVYTRMVTAYLGLEKLDLMYTTGEKALTINPNNADVLAMLSWAIPRKWDSQSMDAQQKLAKVESYGKKAIEVIEAMAKPESLSEEDFTKAKSDKLSMAHSGLGVINMHRGRYADMAVELETATKLSITPDPVDFYLLGVAYEQSRRFGEAATAYEKCTESGPLTDSCKRKAAAVKKLAAAAPKQ